MVAMRIQNVLILLIAAGLYAATPVQSQDFGSNTSGSSFEEILTIDAWSSSEIPRSLSIRGPWGVTGGEHGLLCKPDASTTSGAFDAINPASDGNAVSAAEDAKERTTEPSSNASLYAAAGEGSHECENNSPNYRRGIDAQSTLLLSNLISNALPEVSNNADLEREISQIKVEVEYTVKGIGSGDAFVINFNGREREINRSGSQTFTSGPSSNNFIGFRFVSEEAGWTESSFANVEGPHIDKISVSVRRR